MMQYKYRWLYAVMLSLITIGVGYYYDLERKWLRLAVLRQNEKTLVKRLNDKTPFNQHINTIPYVSLASSANEFTNVSNIVKLAHHHSLSIQTIKSVNSVSVHLLMLQLVVEGYFAQIYSFIQLLEKQNGVKIEHFSCRLSKQHLLRLEAEIWLPLTSMQQIPIMEAHTSSLTNNPFCTSININKEIFPYSVSKLQSFPLQLLKMVGYLKQGERVEALLLLPNNDLVAINQNSILGKERARVLAIQSDRIQVQWQGKSQDILLKGH